MDPAGFCQRARVLIVAGKGGVGKTTVSAALARMAAVAGLRTLVVEIEGKSGLGAMFGRPDPLSYEEVVLSAAGDPPGSATVRARTLTPDDALVEYLEDHGMRRVSKRLVSSGVVDVVASATPGIKDILVLGKVKQLEREGPADLIVIDAPAAGHALTFLTSAAGLHDAVHVGAIRQQASDVLDLLGDPKRCQVLLVTLPEETPVNEAAETSAVLRERVGIELAAVVVNGVYPPIEGLDADPSDAAGEAGVELAPGEAEVLGAAASFRRQRHELQEEQCARLHEALPGLAQLRLPFLFTTEIGRPEVDHLAAALRTAVRNLPDAVLA